MMKRSFVLAAAISVALAGVAGFVLRQARDGPTTAPSSGALFQCPMHPQIVSHEPGLCPICQMHLDRVDESAGAEPANPSASGQRGRIVFYRHPMRPDVTSPTPAKDEMGMDYVPVYEEELAGGAGDVPGHAPFTLSAERQQLIGVTTEAVARRPLDVEIRTVGKVAYDPALYQAVVEYREALRARRQSGESPWREARDGGEAVMRGAALRLRQQGISEAQIAQIAKDDKDPVNLLLPGSSVWVYAQVYEYEVELVRPGQELAITAPSTPGRTFHATVVAVDPILSAATRTARVRALVATPEASLRPQSFVHVTIHVPLGAEIAIPRHAVLDTGEHQTVFVVRDGGRFEPRAVQLGRAAGDYYEVLAGVEPGERVVTSANFLIDSESRFRSALAAFGTKQAAGHVH